ncbi:hypothetical protein SAMN06265379_101931 [Saccharicrinis carchari]|uniref:Uncharacterized protein n=1 Tax=Saccharicrinis carchari TaxID=1168039 RepID=A0A521BH17_SACCC|nr:hypothetical protein SAMN06265379_101931 [Saccharicrinis carchari]
MEITIPLIVTLISRKHPLLAADKLLATNRGNIFLTQTIVLYAQ